MINTMKEYDYYTFSAKNAYNQKILSSSPIGTVKININISSQSIQDNINYSGCQYIGLTHNKEIDDSWVIDYNGTSLKVKYVNPKGRMNQVFLERI